MEEVQRERASSWNSYSPCHLIEIVARAFSKCMGLDPTYEKDGGGTSTTSRAIKRPPRPPLSSGRGDQINRYSS